MTSGTAIPAASPLLLPQRWGDGLPEGLGRAARERVGNESACLQHCAACEPVSPCGGGQQLGQGGGGRRPAFSLQLLARSAATPAPNRGPKQLCWAALTAGAG